MEINSLIDKTSRLKLELCKQCNRIPFNQHGKLQRVNTNLNNSIAKHKDEIKVKKQKIDELLSKLKSSNKMLEEIKLSINYYKNLVRAKAKEEEFIKKRVITLYGQSGWDAIFKVVGAPHCISKKEYKKAVKKK